MDASTLARDIGGCILKRDGISGTNLMMDHLINWSPFIRHPGRRNLTGLSRIWRHLRQSCAQKTPSAYSRALIHKLILVNLLSSTHEHSLDLDSVRRVPYLWTNRAEKTCKSLKRHLPLSRGRHLLRVQFITSLSTCSCIAPTILNRKENSSVKSRPQYTTALSPMYF
jgi:hypothetical protein